MNKTEKRQYLNSGIWVQRKALYLKDKGEECDACGGKSGVDVYHRSWKDVGNEQDWQLDALCKLCRYDVERAIDSGKYKSPYEATKVTMALIKAASEAMDLRPINRWRRAWKEFWK